MDHKQFLRLWEGLGNLGKLEELWIEECRRLGNRGFDEKKWKEPAAVFQKLTCMIVFVRSQSN
jgi:hypothetical protein